MDISRSYGPRAESRSPQPSGSRDALPAAFQELRRSRVFEGVEESLVDDLLAHCTSEQFRAGSTIVDQDRMLESLMIISRGLVDLTRIEGVREYGVLLLASGDLLLPAAAIFSEASLVSARALLRTKLCSLGLTNVHEAMRHSPQFTTNLLAITSGQWRMSVRNILDLSSRNAAQRVGSFLLRLADLQSDEIAPVLPIPKRHLAARLGITAETLSRMLQTIAKNGLYLRGHTIMIKDREQIERFCGPDPYLDRDEKALGVFAL